MRKGGRESIKDQDGGLFSGERDQGDIFSGARKAQEAKPPAKKFANSIEYTDWTPVGNGYEIRQSTSEPRQEIKTPDGNIIIRGIGTNGNSYEEYEMGHNPMRRGGMAWVDKALEELRTMRLPRLEGAAQGDAAPHNTRAEVENSPAPALPQSPTKIDDFGERILGARKDYAAVMKAAESVDVSAEPLSKSWPEPDYQKLLDGGSDPWVVAFIRAARDEIPTKPQKAWKLKGWVEQVTLMRDFASKLLDGTISKEALQERLGRYEFMRLKRTLDGRIDLYQEVGHGLSLKGVTMEAHSYTFYAGTHYSPPLEMWTVEKPAKATAFGSWPREMAKGKTRDEAIANFKARYAQFVAEAKGEAPATEVKFDIYTRDGRKTWVIGKKVGKGYIDLAKFSDVKEARKFLSENRDDLVRELEAAKDIPPERRPTNSPRIGADHRNGANVTPEQFAEAFGFRGVQFGNWVEGDRRQDDLNEAYDALMDLAGVLGLPPRALSLNGELGLAFGARGKGGKRAAAAHYERDMVVINLTKQRGAGSLAHEWWHAVDNYFSRRRGEPKGMLTDAPRLRMTPDESGRKLVENDPTRPEMIAAFAAVMRAIKQTALKARSQKLDERRSKPYWSTDVEMSARAFESHVIAKLADQSASNDYLANIVSEDAYSLEGAYPYPTAGEVPAIRAAFDAFFQAVETREGEGGRVEMFRMDGADMSAVDIDSAEFKQWFGESEAADWGGPTVVYHGTNASFEAFDASRLGDNTDHGTAKLGFFFAASPVVSETFAGKGDGANILPVYLSIQNPYRMDPQEFVNLLEGREQDSDEVLADIADEFRGTGYAIENAFYGQTPYVVETERNREVDSDDLPDDIRALLDRAVKALGPSDTRDAANPARMAEFRQRLEADGYDGIIVEGNNGTEWRELDATNYVAFRPEQIKSAIANSGAFSRADPRIQFRVGQAAMESNVAALEPALRARLSALGLSGTVTLQVVEAVRSMTTGKAQAGAAGSFFQNIIQVAAGGSNPMLTLNHEAIHALRANNILRGIDWKALERMARADTALMAEVNERWGHLNLSRESLAEEAVAEMFATWAAGRAPKGIVGRAFERVTAFFTALRAALKESGLLDAIAEGRIAFRATGVMQDVDQGAIALARDQGVRFTADKSAVAAKFNLDNRQPSDPVVDALPPSLRSRAMEIIRTDARAVAGKLFKPEKAGAGVEVIEAQTADDISWFKAKLYTPEAIFRRLAKSANPRTATVGAALYKLWQKAVKAETDQSEYIHRLRRDVSTIRNEVADEDWTATQALLFQGDAAGIEYTPDQTAAMVASGDLTAPAAAAYHRMRRFFKKLGEFVDQHERKMKPALRKQKFALIRKMARRLGLDQDEFRRRYAYLSDLRAQLARGDGDPEYLGSKIAEAEALLRLDEEGLDWPIVEQWDRELQAIDRRLASLSVQRREGYVPHKFYGSWAIYEVETTEDGDDVLRLLPAYRSDKVRGGQAVQVEEGFHQTRDDAVRAANQHASRNQDKRLVVKPVEFKFPGSDATVVSDASLRHIMRQAESVADQFGLDAEVMVESLNGVVKVRNRRRNASFKNKRAGIAGYSKELDRVIDTHVGEVVRYVVMDELKYDAINTFERTGLSRNRSVIQENPTLATYVEQWFSDINGQKQGAERQLDALLSKPWARPLNVAMATGTAAFLAGGGIVGSPAVGLAVGSYVGYRFYRSLKDGGDFKTRAVTGAMLGDMAHLKLGAFTNVMSAVVNLSQTTMNTWPVLGSKWTAIGIKRYTKAMTDMLRGKANHDITLLRRGNVDTAFKISEVSPHLFEQDSKLARASMFLFNQAESLNRGVAFLGAYARAEAQGHPPGKAMAYARRMLTRTQFHYGAANKPEVLRNTLLRVPLQFKNFLAQQLTFMAGLNKREAAKFMLALFLMAGLIGMPGAEMLDALTEWLFGFSPLVEVKRLMFDAAAKGELAGGIATMLVHGLPALAGLDISSRVGMSQIIPDEGRDLQGPWWSTIATAARHGAEGASLVDQIRNLSPGIGNPLKMVEASANGLPVTAWPREAAKALAGEDSAFTDDKSVLTSPYKRGRVEYEPRSGEMAMKALGAMPIRESELRDLNAVTLHDSQIDKKFTGRHIDRIIRAIKEGDDPSPLYEAAADDGVTITKAKIKNALKQDGLTRMERAFSQMPDATESWAREVYGRITEEE
jgi:hypothetical protein